MDNLMSKVLTIILISNQILPVKEINLIGSRNEIKEPTAVNFNRISSEYQQMIDDQRFNSKVDKVVSNDIPPDRILRSQVEINDTRKQAAEDTKGRHLSKQENQTERTHKRISNGWPLPIDQIPYLVQIMENDLFTCGGTLISYTHVLSAAHCFMTTENNKDFELANITTFSIRYDTKCLGKGGNVVEVTEVVIHPDFMNTDVKPEWRTNLAVAKLSKRVRASIFYRIPAKLPITTGSSSIENLERDERTYYVAGWGYSTSTSCRGCKLMGTHVKAHCFDNCSKYHPNLTRSIHMCAYAPGKDVCFLDAGSGLYRKDFIWGVVSWFKGCANFHYPGYFIRVDSNADFIMEAMASSRATILGNKDRQILTLVGFQIIGWIAFLICYIQSPTLTI